MVAQNNGHASLIGTSLGQYAVQTLIGRGAVGTVYLAKDTRLGRPVALKVLLGSLARNPEQVRRFQREAKSAAPLQHPNIVSIYEAGIRNGTPFIAMEYVEGESLERFLRRKNAPLPWQHALHVAEQIAQALDCAHSAGVVHRDVKPANILLDQQGRVRLTDFGIASSVQGKAKWGQTELGRMLGTPEYMSPEQCTGDREISPASDLFSLGVMVYRMLSGHLPFEGHSSVSLMKSITADTAPRLNQVVTGIPDDVARLVAHLLEKDPKDRPASARSAVEMIQRLQRENGGTSAMPEALNAFIHDGLEKRRSKIATPATPKNSGRAPKLVLPSRRKYFVPISFMARVAVFLFAAFALLGAGYWHYVRPRHVIPPAPMIAEKIFRSAENGLMFASLPNAAWSVKSLRWVGDQATLLVEVEGPRGSAYAGARGILAVDPEKEAMYSVRAPSSPILDPDFWRISTSTAGLGQIPVIPEETPMCNSFLLQAADGRNAAATQASFLVGQFWNTARPRLVPMASRPKADWSASGTAPWDALNAIDMAAKPDGYTVCLLLDTPGSGGNYLAEHDVRWKDKNRLAPRLTSPGAPIVPGTIQYSPDGTKVLYMRRRNSDEQELWVVRSDGQETDGKPLASGSFDGRAVFSPEGDRVAVTQHTAAGTRLILLRTGDSAVEAEPGPGQITPESWHPSGQYLVVASPGSDGGVDQLWAVETDAPYRRRAITQYPKGILDGGTIARDGRWVVTVATSEQGQVLVFVNLNTVLFAA